jgi:tetratricopeptide (TPR) repeat protein
MEFDDFVIQFLPGQAGAYGVWVVESPAGRGKGSFEIPSSLGAAARGTLSSRSRELDGDADPHGAPAPSPRESGDLLFQALFKNGVGILFQRSLGGTERVGNGLRIRLGIDPELDRVTALPWELLWLPDREEFLGLNRNITIVRSLDVPRPVMVPSPGSRLHILAVASAPRGYDRLDLDRERGNLESAVKKWPGADLVFLEKPTLQELRAALLSGTFHVLHFMGHGSFEESTGRGALLFEDDEGGPNSVSGESLAARLKGFPDLRLVVLNACHTARMEAKKGLHPFAGVASSLVSGGIPAVVAMRSRISDQAAVAFSGTFYQRLAAGDPFDVAAAEGRLAIDLEEGETGGWDLPVLFLNGGAGWFSRHRSFTKALAACLALLVAILSLGFTFRKTYQALTLNSQGALLLEEALALNNQGALLLEQQRLKEARDALEAALRLDDGYAAAHANLASVEEEQGQYNEALAQAEAAVKKAPSEASYQYNLGRLLVKLGRYEEAIPNLVRTTELEPCHAAAFNELGRVYLGLDEPAEARRVIEAGLRCDRTTGPPARGPLLKNLGRANLAEKHPGEAAQHLEQALYFYARERRPDLWEPTYLLASAYAENGQRDLACKRLRDFSHLAAAEATPWAPAAKLLAQQKHCEGVFEEE